MALLPILEILGEEKHWEMLILPMKKWRFSIVMWLFTRGYTSIIIYIHILGMLRKAIYPYGSKYLLRKWDWGMIWGGEVPSLDSVWIHRV